jgi:hypothetical protein
VGESRYRGIRWSKPASYVLTLDNDGNSLILDKLQSEYAFNLVSASWETESQTLEAQYKQVREDVEQPGGGDAASGEEEGLFDEEQGKPDESNPFDYRHYLGGLPQAPKSTSVTSTPILVASKPVVPPKMSISRPATSATRQVSASRPRPLKKTQPSVPPPQVRLERGASEKRSSTAREDDAGEEAEANNDDSDEGLIIDMGEGYQPPPKKRAVNLGVRQPISLRAAASASPHPGFSPAPPEAGSGYEEDDEEDDEEMADQVDGHEEDAEEGDVTELALGSPAALDGTNIPSLARRQSGWDADASAELEAEMMRALEADEEEEAVVVQAANLDSEEESEEE